MKYSNGITIKNGDFVVTDDGYERFQILDIQPHETANKDREMSVNIFVRGGNINSPSDSQGVIKMITFTSGEALFVARGSIKDTSNLWKNPIFEKSLRINSNPFAEQLNHAFKNALKNDFPRIISLTTLFTCFILPTCLNYLMFSFMYRNTYEGMDNLWTFILQAATIFYSLFYVTPLTLITTKLYYNKKNVLAYLLKNFLLILIIPITLILIPHIKSISLSYIFGDAYFNYLIDVIIISYGLHCYLICKPRTQNLSLD